MATNFGMLAGNFMQAFGQARLAKEQKEDAKKERDAKMKLFELQLKREQTAAATAEEQQKSRAELFGKLRGTPGINPGASIPQGAPEGPVLPPAGYGRQKPPSLTELLADPQNAMLFLQSGYGSLGDIAKLGQSTESDTIQTLRALAADPALMDAEIRRRQAGASQINLGEQGLAKPPPGFARPNPTQPGLMREPGGPPTPGQESLDKAFGQDAAAWVSAGGFADTQKSIEQLGQAKAALDAVASGKSQESLTGPVVSRLPAFAKALFNPKAVAIRESVEEIVQRNLRLVLGAQFTEKEGDRLIARAYNENLGEAENAKRVGRLMKQLQSAAKAKQEAVDYFNEHGTLEGFAGKVWTMADFDVDAGGGSGSTGKTIDFSELPD